MELVRNRNGRLLRCGHTTGVCAAAAAGAAARMLLSGRAVARECVETPDGLSFTLEVLDGQMEERWASCAVRKDAGDDPDVTDGALVYARVERHSGGTVIDGGTGVGRVTRPGLDQPVGAAAINRVPRQMIAGQLAGAARDFGYEGGFSVVISVPGGEALAARTFNPRMGIQGGISIIGTTGLVEPMSHRAVGDTVRLELRQLRAAGAGRVLLTPGNYGETFAREGLGLHMNSHVACSNFIGEAIDCAVELGFSDILLVGHIGKLVKLGIGMTNTHSSVGDGRMETLSACALEAGAELAVLKDILHSVTADGALELLGQAGLVEETMKVLARRISDCLARRVPDGVGLDWICFTNAGGGAVLARSAGADRLMELWRTKE